MFLELVIKSHFSLPPTELPVLTHLKTFFKVISFYTPFQEDFRWPSSRSCENRSPPGGLLQTCCIIPSPQVVMYDLLKGRCLDQFFPMLIASKLYDLEDVQVAYPDNRKITRSKKTNNTLKLT